MGGWARGPEGPAPCIVRVAQALSRCGLQASVRPRGTGLQLAGQEPLPAGHVEGFAVKTKTKASGFLKPLLLQHQGAGPVRLWQLTVSLLSRALSTRPGAPWESLRCTEFRTRRAESWSLEKARGPARGPERWPPAAVGPEPSPSPTDPRVARDSPPRCPPPHPKGLREAGEKGCETRLFAQAEAPLLPQCRAAWPGVVLPRVAFHAAAEPAEVCWVLASPPGRVCEKNCGPPRTRSGSALR